jgi:hypothetical protein
MIKYLCVTKIIETAIFETFSLIEGMSVNDFVNL